MDKKLLKEEIERIHKLTYGKEVILDEGIIDNILNFLGLNEKDKKDDDPTKSDLLQGTLNDLITTLKSIKSPIKQGEKGKQKEIEAVQVALALVMDENPLPKGGIDGTFGPETADAVKKFKEQNNIQPEKNPEKKETEKKKPNNEEINEGIRDWFRKLIDRISGSEESKETITPELISVLLKKLTSKKVQDKDISPYLDTKTSVKLTGDWLEITKELLRRHEGFQSTAKWDENAYRGGYGSDKKLINGQLSKATQNTTWTRQEAEDTMHYEIENYYAPTIVKSLGRSNWDKLNDRQKGALVSMGYNVGPHFLSVKDYGRKIKDAIESDDMDLAANYIENGPTTGSVSGKSYKGLVRRRKEEAQIFLS